MVSLWLLPCSALGKGAGLAEHLVELLYQSWRDLDEAISGLTSADAESRYEELSRIAWTVGHVTQQVDSWFNVRFQGESPHPVLSDPMFHTGASGESAPWPEVLAGVEEVRRRARAFLDGLAPADLDRTVAYDGGIEYLRPGGLRLGYALVRTAAHHFLHAGEILTIRSLLGHELEDSWVWGQELL